VRGKAGGAMRERGRGWGGGGGRGAGGETVVEGEEKEMGRRGEADLFFRRGGIGIGLGFRV